MPLQHGNVANVHCRGRRAAFERHRPRQAIDDLVVPLVEHRDAEGAVRQAADIERAVRVALGERNIVAIRIAHAHKALREAQWLARLASIQVFVGRAAVVEVRDTALDAVVAVDPVAHRRQAVVDDLRVGKADRHVEPGRAELLEVSRAANLDEGVMRLLTIQRVGLQPLLAARDAIGGRRRDDAVAARHQVGDDGLANQRRDRLRGRVRPRIGFIQRAGRDHADDAVLRRRDSARVEPGSRVDRALQRIGQRHVEHVVAHLPGRVSGAACVVPELDFKAAEAGLASRPRHCVGAAMHIHLTVERGVVLEHEDRYLRRLQRRLLQHDGDRPLPSRDRGAAQTVPALALGWREIRTARAGWAVQRNVELPHRASRLGRIHRLGRTGGVRKPIARIARQDRDVVALLRIEHGLARVNRHLLRGIRAADTVADVAYRGHMRTGGRIEHCLAEFACVLAHAT